MARSSRSSRRTMPAVVPLQPVVVRSGTAFAPRSDVAMIRSTVPGSGDGSAIGRSYPALRAWTPRVADARERSAHRPHRERQTVVVPRVVIGVLAGLSVGVLFLASNVAALHDPQP